MAEVCHTADVLPHVHATQSANMNVMQTASDYTPVTILDLLVRPCNSLRACNAGVPYVPHQ